MTNPHMRAHNALVRNLQLLGAPAEVVARAADPDRSPRSDRLWIVAARGEEIDEPMIKERAELASTIATLIGANECEQWIDAMSASGVDHDLLAKRIAERAAVVTTGYRAAQSAPIAAGFESLGWLCRALGAIETARARRVAVIETRARELAALVGAGHSAFTRSTAGLQVDLRVPQSPVNDELAYAAACVTEAWQSLAGFIGV